MAHGKLRRNAQLSPPDTAQAWNYETISLFLPNVLYIIKLTPHFVSNSTYIEMSMQDSRGVDAKHTRSDALRSALLGSHMSTAVSKTAAGMSES